ncbi:hypothetical protein [uncultured Lactobacillus sp.]|uniref:hypothetical protein n=1 Tax=uncultured Lactobacillus sp. TaxID=153152 RepID=UPI0025830BDF|nr:hypothetical protein [uncultured Lactobacillus sp.]
MAYETTDQLIAEVADHWNKRDDTVFYQLLDIYNEHLTKISDEAKKIDRWRMLKEAKGTTLDLLGQDRKAYRISDDDDTYRFIIFIHILMSHAQGTIPSMVKIMSTALNADPNKFEVYKTGLRHIGMKIPFDYVQNIQMQKFIIKNIQRLVAMGYWIDEIKFYFGSPLPLYIGVGSQDKNHEIERSKTIWWDGWKSKTDDNLHVGIYAQQKDEHHEKSKTLWWDGWKARAPAPAFLGSVGRIVRTQVWHSSIIWREKQEKEVHAGLTIGNKTITQATQSLTTE